MWTGTRSVTASLLTPMLMSIDVHVLRRGRANAASRWKLMVVIENWWSGDNEPLKTTTWGQVIEGNPKAVVSWMRMQDRRTDSTVENKQSGA